MTINNEYTKDIGVGKPSIGVNRYRTQNATDFSKDNYRRINVDPADAIDQRDKNNFNDEE